jgi:excisionase family DNA binding protein
MSAAIGIPGDRLAVTTKEASRITSISPGTFRHYARIGKIKVVKVGRRTIIPISTLRDLVHAGVK